MVVLRALPRAGALPVGGLVLLVLIMSVVPVATILASGRVVAAISSATGSGMESSAGRALVGDLVWLAVLVAVLHAGRAWLDALAAIVGRRVDSEIARSVMAAACSPEGVEELEDPAYADLLARTQEVGSGVRVRDGVASLVTVVTSRLRGVGAFAVLAAYTWWMPIVLFAAWQIVRRWLAADVALMLRRIEVSTEDFRHAAYARDLALSGHAAKEVRIFGIGRWLSDRYERRWRQAISEVWSARASDRKMMFLALASFLAALTIVVSALAYDAIQGSASAAQLTVAVQAALAMSAFGYAGDAEWMLDMAAKPQSNATALVRLVGKREPLADVAGDGAPMPLKEIVFHDVWFGYDPGRPVIKGLELTVPAGRSLAIVGANGSGKTTLVKLLLGLYVPSRGSITVDGIDLRELDMRMWRRQLSVIFQDFMRFESSFADNIEFNASADRRPALERAVLRAGVAELAGRLSNGWGTTVSRLYRDGVDLSGGEWQRVAIARMLARLDAGARVAVLDEPTANLGIREEAALFEQLTGELRGTTLLLISHRFSTVRAAERIVVLDAGRAIEDGAHDELLAAGGRYADMFGMQAQPFREVSHE